MKKIVTVLAISLLVVVVGLFSFLMAEGVLIGAWDIPDKINWKAKTTPLKPAVANDLCEAFALPKDDEPCHPGSVVYAPDYFDAIRATFEPKDKPWATYDQVQATIGKYQYRYEPPVAERNGPTYFVARYDFNGDQVFPVVIFFYGDGRLWRMTMGAGD